MTNPWKELQWLPMEILTLCLVNLFTTQLSGVYVNYMKIYVWASQ